MKLWLLRPRDDLEKKDHPWVPWYDKPFGYVVRAETEEEAREMARIESGTVLEEDAWLNPRYAICVELTAEGPPGVVIGDFAAAG